MFFSSPPEFIAQFVENLDMAIREHKPESRLSSIQKGWLAFCMTGILLTNSVCWKRFERAGLRKYSTAALCWMFRHSHISWDLLLVKSLKLIIRYYGITEAIIAFDDSDRKRSKSTRKISKVHKLKDKSTGGFMMGQSLVFLMLITSKVTVPAGFAFYMPDPEMTKWTKQNEKHKKAGTPVHQRPPKPPKNEKYPTKQQIALDLLRQFKENHPEIRIKCVLADALYGDKDFIDGASEIFDGVQVVSQLRDNQNVLFRGRKMSVEKFFSIYKGVTQTIRIRGDKQVVVTIGSARLKVCSHDKKRFVIALKYEGEEEYRYLEASDLSRRTQDIAEAYTFRWLAEVFFEDWKSYEGWNKMAKQQGEEGSSRGLILSLLVDHCLLLHPEQTARIESNLPAFTVGSLLSRVKADALLAFIRELVFSDDPEEKLGQLGEKIKEVFDLRPSGKHMVSRELGRLEPTPALKYRAAEAG